MRPEYSDEIVSLTKGYGGDWGINHTLRLLHLIEIIGKGREYDPDVVWVAAYLHDWGGYSPWIQPGDQSMRSDQQKLRDPSFRKGISLEFSSTISWNVSPCITAGDRTEALNPFS